MLLHVTSLRRNLFHVTDLMEPKMAVTHVNERVQRHRDALRKAGLRPVQLWLPDTRRPGFAEECLRQSRLTAIADAADTGLEQLMDEAMQDLDGWTA